jgi:NAD(P)-dependent dehydrogenase (short-subunit alcohol dehydrogenase family)
MGRLIVITGGSGGIGSAVARRLAGNATLALVARDEARLTATAAETGAHAFPADVLDPDAFGEVVARIESELGEIDGLVHAVGSVILRPIHALSLEDWRRTLELNVTSAFIVTKAVISKMMRRRRGSVVLFSSVAAHTGLSNHEAIAAAKGAVEGFVRSAAISYSRYGVRVNAVAPALIKTELSKSLWSNDAMLAVSSAMHPLGRVGEPDDAAAAAVYLLSDDAGWITGQILGVDGGLAAGQAPPRVSA